MFCSYYEHEQEVANGWDSTPTGTTDLLSLMVSMDYPYSVQDLFRGKFDSTKYPKESDIINKMRYPRKKGRTSLDAMKDIVTSFVNKDVLANIIKHSGVEVNLFNEKSREINTVSKHEPDFIMKKSNMFGTVTRNVKMKFTTNPLTYTTFISLEKFIEYHKSNTSLLIVNTYTKQFAVVHVHNLKSTEIETVYQRNGQVLVKMNIVPKRVPFYSEGNITNLVKTLFK